MICLYIIPESVKSELKGLFFKSNFEDLYQTAGLKLINLMARSGGYDVSHHNYNSSPASPRQQLDQYLIDDDPLRPTIVFFYGGNWRSGEKSDYRFVADSLCQQGFNVIVPNYRLYPEVRFDQILSDAKQAYTWVLKNLKHQNIFLMGHSAGAQLAALLSLDTSLISSELAPSERLKGMIGLAGPYDFFPFTEDDHWDLFAPEAEYANSQAVNFVRPDGPPLYLLHGEDDHRVRRGHSKSLMEKTIDAGGRADREVYSSMGHVEILLSYTRLHRNNSKLVIDVAAFINKNL